MGLIVEALMKVAVEMMLHHIIGIIKKYPISVLMGLLSAMRYFR